ncbi:hypothetical protein AGMMS49982_04520 [Bacteroidia bacterium]|nr:hypothetical protein AGMMS49982_04520 [Bacteroidia bacterium]
MSKHKKESFFWTSYSDLMTSLFFVMLVLFVLVIVLLHKKISEQGATIKELERITQIDRQFEPLIKSGKFQYYPDSKKFVAKDLVGHEIFQPLQTKILSEYIKPTIEVGREVEILLQKLSKENADFSYQLVIEGNMANRWDHSINKDQREGYKTSYERALAVYLLWLSNGIDLRKYNTEVLICGSGYSGLDRDKTEDNNKRFSIQIIPKISSPNK